MESKEIVLELRLKMSVHADASPLEYGELIKDWIYDNLNGKEGVEFEDLGDHLTDVTWEVVS